MSALTLDIVTPEEILVSEVVEQVVVPGADGEFGVLVDHAPVISNLRAGVVRAIDGNGKVKKRILVSSGFAEITGERCTILATEAHDFDNVSKDELQKRLTAIKKIHDEAVGEREKEIAAKDVDIAQDIVDAFILEQDTH
jgi:F-type H+-transporting ATPase subunit epsilon